MTLTGVAASRPPHATTTLALDIGGTGLKGAVLDEAGVIRGDRVRVATPRPADPRTPTLSSLPYARS